MGHRTTFAPPLDVLRRTRRAAFVAITAVAVACGEAAPTPPVAIPQAPLVDCRGVPAATCQQALADAQANAGGAVVVQIRVACTKLPCTLQSGEAQVDVLYTNGRTDSFGTGWSGAAAPAVPAPPPAPLPVAPVCQGVPAQQCHEFAQAGVEEIGEREVSAIVVTCKPGPCTPAAGGGETIVTFADGTTRTSSWQYQSGG